MKESGREGEREVPGSRALFMCLVSGGCAQLGWRLLCDLSFASSGFGVHLKANESLVLSLVLWVRFVGGGL